MGSVVDPDPSLFVRILILPSTSKNSKKNLDCYLLLFVFSSLKTDVNVTSKSNKQKNVINLCFTFVAILSATDEKIGSEAESGSGSVGQWYGSADPDL